MGKVHGSLARAGKVKSQTPKARRPSDQYPASWCTANPNIAPRESFSWGVFYQADRRSFAIEMIIPRLTPLPFLQVEPQEKKKPATGRAKKRLQYTRRFVNVQMTGGKRRVSNFVPNLPDNITFSFRGLLGVMAG